jgi:heptose I phosphotransferase
MIWIRADLRPLFDGLAFEDYLALGQRPAKASAGGARRTAWFERGGRGFYVKVHTGAGWGEIVRSCLQGKRPIVDARTEALALERCERHDIPAPRLAAWGRRGLDPGARRSFVVTEELAGAERLSAFLARELPGRGSFPLRARLARRLGELVARLHGARLAHQDLYLDHVFLRAGAGEPELFLLDLHRALPRRATSGRWRVKDLTALHGSARKLGGTRADAVRFLRAYAGGGRRLGDGERELWRRCAARAARRARVP